MTTTNELQSRQTADRQSMIRDEWTAHWDLAQRRARLWVNKWIAAKAYNGTLDRDAIIADVLDLAYERYASYYGESQPRDITRAIVQNIKLVARECVSKHIADNHGIVHSERFEEMVVNTLENDEPEEWLKVLLAMPDTSGRDLMIQVAIGKASGLGDRELSREIGISHVGVGNIVGLLKNVLRAYYLDWLMDKTERREIKLSPSRYFELLFQA